MGGSVSTRTGGTVLEAILKPALDIPCFTMVNKSLVHVVLLSRSEFASEPPMSRVDFKVSTTSCVCCWRIYKQIQTIPGTGMPLCAVCTRKRNDFLT